MSVTTLTTLKPLTSLKPLTVDLTSPRGRGVLVDPSAFFAPTAAKSVSRQRQPLRTPRAAAAVSVPASNNSTVLWRRQLALAATVAAMIAALVVGGEAASAGAKEAAAATPGALHVVVQSGDSIWSIARRVQPTGDVRPLVDNITRANGSAAITAGQTILVPLQP
jgi:nucleoid-associated protein YgaU